MEWLNVNCRTDPVQVSQFSFILYVFFQYKLAIATLTIEKVRAEVNKVTQFFCSAGIGNNKVDVI